MKKIFICLIMVFMAICANAQVTWNVRAGISLQNFNIEYDDWREESVSSGVLTMETNIPFKKGSPFTFSPSLSIWASPNYCWGGLLPLHIGYRFFIGEKFIFRPKIGPMIGSLEYRGDIFGPSIELPFEYKHFIVALQMQGLWVFGEEGSMHYGGTLTFGYKF